MGRIEEKISKSGGVGDEGDQFEVLKIPGRLLLEKTRKSLGKDNGSDLVLITERNI